MIKCRSLVLITAFFVSLLLGSQAFAQSIRIPWNGYGHDAQHTAISPTPSQPLNQIHWHTPVDLNPVYTSGGSLLIHYGSPAITRSNTVLVPVKTGTNSGFEIKAIVGETGVTNWTQTTDYRLPPHGWTPSFSGTLTPKNRLYFPGGGGTVYYCDEPDTTNAPPIFGRMAFYGFTNYLANSNAYLGSVWINTPITADRYGNIFFGFEVIGANPLNLKGGLARISYDGSGSWIAANAAVTNIVVDKIAMCSAPALSNDHQTVYIGVNSTASGYGALVALDSRTLQVLASVTLHDVVYTNSSAVLNDNGSASPTVAPDGDVYFGVLENPKFSNHDRGWLLHFNRTLTQANIPGAFGWDDTPSIVDASLVASYHGASPYLLMAKYNNYANVGGDGLNKIAVLDPFTSMKDPISGAMVMAEVITMLGPTPDPGNQTTNHPNAVREWCINSAAVDPATKSILANSEDGKLYRWDLTSNTLSQTNLLNAGTGEAYTPTLIGVDGTVYAINNATLYAVGR